MLQIESSTRKMLILGRAYADGRELCCEALNVPQAQMKLTSLHAQDTKGWL